MLAKIAFAASALLASSAFALPASNETLEERASGLATVYETCVNANEVALTFDDGPYVYHKYISDELTKAGAKGTFFINGNNYVCAYDSPNPQNLIYALKAGHELQAHTWSHPHLTKLSYSQKTTEFQKINTLIQKTTGLQPAFMRPPYGEYNDDVLKVAKSFNQGVVMWNYDSGDSVGASMTEQKAVYSNFAKKSGKKGIFLNHEVYKSTAYTLLPSAIKSLQSKGYKLVTLSQCLGKAPYLNGKKSTDAVLGKRDSSWKC